MLKYIHVGSFDNLDVPSASILGVGSKGADTEALTKLAAASPLMEAASRVRPEKGYTFIHLVSVADGDTYGPNRNGDHFPGKSRMMRVPNPRPGEPTTIKLAAGLEKYHSTFKTHAKVYKHHRNTPNDPVYGEIIAEAYNPLTKRGELIVKLPTEKWSDELTKLAAGEDIPFSMACFVSGTQVRREYDVVSINSIAIGDKVVTHNGVLKEVTNIMRREAYSTYELTIGSNAALTTTATDEHPFLAAKMSRSRRTALVHANVEDIGPELEKSLEWVPAKELTVQHYIAIPRERYVSKSPGAALARLMMYVTAFAEPRDGNKFRIVVTEKVETLLKEIAGLCADLNIRDYKQKSIAGRDVVMFSSMELARELDNCDDLFDYIYKSDDTSVMHFMGALFNISGYSDASGIHWVLNDKRHALLLTHCMLATGIPVSVCSKRGGSDKFIFTVPSDYHEFFDPICRSAWPLKVTDRNYRTVFTKKYAFIPVKEIKRHRSAVTVYNLSVEDDESYTANLLAVHNCTIPYDICSYCGNKSPNRFSYCDHIRYELNKFAADGTQICMINDQPTFKDISGVHRPADSIAYSLRKVASARGLSVLDRLSLDDDYLSIIRPDLYTHELEPVNLHKSAALRKLCEMEKHILTSGSGSIICDDPVLSKLEAFTPEAGYGDLADDEINTLRKADLTHVLDALADSYVCLPFKTFYKLVLGPKEFTANRPIIEEAAGGLPGVFSSCISNHIEDAPAIAMRAGAIPDKVMQVIKSIIPRMGMDAPNVIRRVTISIAKNASAPAVAKNATVDNLSKEAKFFAEEYARYQLAVASKWLEKQADDATIGLLVLHNFV